jgi:hypothetical protein
MKKTKPEDALRARIAQLDKGLSCLNKANGPYLSRAIMEAVREELDTFLKWMEAP